MKFLIWFGCFFVYGLVTTVLNKNGVGLGGIPTFLLLALFIILARTLSRKWDEHKWYEAKQVEESENNKGQSMNGVTVSDSFSEDNEE
ncbi:MAG: hypothetical protein IJO76_03470 [Clostridia bacterium]|nr:hypothetical protein [Clostridia bacterium]